MAGRGGEGAAVGTGAEGVVGGAFPDADGTAPPSGLLARGSGLGLAARLLSGEALLGELLVARSLMPMALPQLVAPGLP